MNVIPLSATSRPSYPLFSCNNDTVTMFINIIVKLFLERLDYTPITVLSYGTSQATLSGIFIHEMKKLGIDNISRILIRDSNSTNHHDENWEFQFEYIQDNTIIVIDDIIETGDTIRFVRNTLNDFCNKPIDAVFTSTITQYILNNVEEEFLNIKNLYYSNIIT